ncbi:MAG: isoprenylcysteine carboxylmethyltransferase family protein [Chitinophagaceae bacterium]|nr:MAG: isoprenylcysteine carboxylmethyltransferase family protein [Chitinophagaceae bacterium]
MDSFLKIYLPIYFLIYLATAFVVPSYRIRKQTGINPVTFGKEDTAHNYIGFIMKLLIAALFLVVLLFSFSTNIYNYLVPINYLQNKIIVNIGIAVINIALLLVIVAQSQMKKSWRIGIDDANKTELITKGLFSVSRNPIYVGMIATVWGIFLILPNTLTFFLSAATYLIIQIHIRLEEEFLEKQHGEVYTVYKSKTKRLI